MFHMPMIQQLNLFQQLYKVELLFFGIAWMSYCHCYKLYKLFMSSWFILSFDTYILISFILSQYRWSDWLHLLLVVMLISTSWAMNLATQRWGFIVQIVEFVEYKLFFLINDFSWTRGSSSQCQATISHFLLPIVTGIC